MSDNQDLLSRIRSAVNAASVENVSNTPDFVIAEFLVDVLGALNKAINSRERWYDKVATGDAEGSLNVPPAEPGPTAATLAFAAWLTTRNKPVTIGSTHNAAIVAELVDEFRISQGWSVPAEGWREQLKPYPKG